MALGQTKKGGVARATTGDKAASGGKQLVPNAPIQETGVTGNKKAKDVEKGKKN